MRPSILEHGYSLRAKVLFGLIRIISGRPLPDAARITFFRADFYGTQMKALTQEAMRGHSEWSVADRELMAAYVSSANRCAFCVRAHTATAARAYQDPAKVAAVLDDVESAPIEEGLRATLRMLAKLTTDGALRADDVRTALDAGVSSQKIEDALAVGFAFNTTDRLANAFAFDVLTPEAFEAGAKYLLKRGYR